MKLIYYMYISINLTNSIRLYIMLNIGSIKERIYKLSKIKIKNVK